MKTNLGVDAIVSINSIFDIFTSSKNKIIVIFFINRSIITQEIFVYVQAHYICLTENIKISIFDIVTSTQSSYRLL